MSFLGTPFQYDIFVSYSHADQVGEGMTPLRHWSIQLIRRLVQDIRTRRPEYGAIREAIDTDLPIDMPLTDELKSRVTQSGIFLILMSPPYLESSWCNKERVWFEEEVLRRGQQRGCVLVVRAMPTDEQGWPDALKDEDGHSVLGFWFHPRPASDETNPFGYPDPGLDDREFYRALAGLSTKVMERLKDLKEQEELLKMANGHQAPKGNKLYLDALPGDEEVFEKWRHRLAKEHYDIVPSKISLPPDGLKAALAEQRTRRGILKECQAIIIPRVRQDIQNQLKNAFDDREALSEETSLDLIVLDHLSEPIEEANELNIQVLNTQSAWSRELEKALSSGDAD